MHQPHTHTHARHRVGLFCSMNQAEVLPRSREHTTTETGVPWPCEGAWGVGVLERMFSAALLGGAGVLQLREGRGAAHTAAQAQGRGRGGRGRSRVSQCLGVHTQEGEELGRGFGPRGCACCRRGQNITAGAALGTSGLVLDTW